MIGLSCQCGKVKGQIQFTGRPTFNRAICYCKDCRSFLHYLGHREWLDASGGSDLIQVPPKSVSYTQGHDNIVGMRLSPKGLYRWHSSCCKTPLGNTLKPVIPFVGILRQTLSLDDKQLKRQLGPIRGYVNASSAVAPIPRQLKAFSTLDFLVLTAKLLDWKLRHAWPNPFFESETTAPKYPIEVIPREERLKLRHLS